MVAQRVERFFVLRWMRWTTNQTRKQLDTHTDTNWDFLWFYFPSSLSLARPLHWASSTSTLLPKVLTEREKKNYNSVDTCRYFVEENNKHKQSIGLSIAMRYAPQQLCWMLIFQLRICCVDCFPLFYRHVGWHIRIFGNFLLCFASRFLFLCCVMRCASQPHTIMFAAHSA